MAGDGLDLTVGATRFQEIDGGVLTQAMKGVFEFVTVQLKAFTLTLPILVECILAKGLTSRGGSWAATSVVVAARSGCGGGMGCLACGRSVRARSRLS